MYRGELTSRVLFEVQRSARDQLWWQCTELKDAVPYGKRDGRAHICAAKPLTEPVRHVNADVR